MRTRGIAAKTRKWLQLADLSVFSFVPCPSPRLLTRLGPLMSTSMCGCGCSIISSLMKRLGCAVCCSDLFSRHTSEQLQRLAAGCPPQPKVTPPRSHLCPPLNGLCDYSGGPRVKCCAASFLATRRPRFYLSCLLCNCAVHIQSRPIPVCKTT